MGLTENRRLTSLYLWWEKFAALAGCCQPDSQIRKTQVYESINQLSAGAKRLRKLYLTMLAKICLTVQRTPKRSCVNTYSSIHNFPRRPLFSTWMVFAASNRCTVYIPKIVQAKGVFQSLTSSKLGITFCVTAQRTRRPQFNTKFVLESAGLKDSLDAMYANIGKTRSLGHPTK